MHQGRSEQAPWSALRPEVDPRTKAAQRIARRRAPIYEHPGRSDCTLCCEIRSQRLVPHCAQREVARKAARRDAEHLLEVTCQVALVAKPALCRYMRGRHTASKQR